MVNQRVTIRSGPIHAHEIRQIFMPIKYVSKHFLAFGIVSAMAIPATAQTFTSLVSFNGTTDGNQTLANLVQGGDGNLYSTTLNEGANGGTNYGGTVFKMTPTGTLTTIYSFCSQTNCIDGSQPDTVPTLGADGNFYGVTSAGGTYNHGTVFKIASAGTLTTLHSFGGTLDGALPAPGPIQATDGNFYGTTEVGGANGLGEVYKITPTGTLTTLHSFDGADGSNPFGPMIQATDGNFYGATSAGGASNDGTLFKITSTGTLTTLYSFSGTDGQEPRGVVQATDGNFYGTTYQGGANNDGTVFKITPTGTLTTLHSFSGADGNGPRSAVIQATDGNFYGATSAGGANNDGTLFKITSMGTLTTLYSFNGTYGENARGLVQHTNGTFYGTTRQGGASGDGTVFSLSLGLGAFVKTLPTSGKVGAAIKILGTNLTGATSVNFNGTAATFTVITGSLISTSVPTGATTGSVQVTTPNGTLTSNVVFRVKP
jgi:uncharacterized repeat protein (TIGR03803 family)